MSGFFTGNGCVFIETFAISINTTLFVPTACRCFCKNCKTRQSEQQQKQAHHAVSWFYEMQTAPIRNPINTAMTSIIKHFSAWSLTPALSAMYKHLQL
jgi:hypothetical protein